MKAPKSDVIAINSKWLLKPAPIATNIWPESEIPVVSICCVTYNHERFIRDCLNGFLIQETTFPVEILIHDDASTDRTADVIKEYEKVYPYLIKAVYQKENKWSKGIRPNPEFNFPRAKGKYIAFCEGDDYWSSKEKLQRQFDILEENPWIKVCFHKVFILKDREVNKALISVPVNLGKDVFSCKEITKTNIIPTCSVLAVRDAVTETPDWFYRLPMNDWPRWVMACKDGCAYIINSEMGVYRIHDGGAWSTLSKNDQLIGDYDFYCEIEKNGPISARTAAVEARRELVIKLLNREEVSLNRIKNHIILGPLLRAWKFFINKNILL